MLGDDLCNAKTAAENIRRDLGKPVMREDVALLLSLRGAANAKRDKKALLAQTNVDSETVMNGSIALLDNRHFNAFFDSLTQDQAVSLMQEGHGGALCDVLRIQTGPNRQQQNELNQQEEQMVEDMLNNI